MAAMPSHLLATAEGSAPRSGSTAARPEVVVKRASVSSPLRARTAADGMPTPAHAVAPVELVPHRTSAQILLRRVRAVLFLAALAAVPATVILSAVHVLKWLSVALAVAVLVVMLGWLRLSAISEQKARRARRAELRRLERLRTAARETASAPRAAHAAAAKAAPVEAARAAHHNADPDAWQPVPVPPPTYTLKEPAHRPEPAAEEWRPVGTDVPVPIDVEDDEIEVMAAAHGRRVMGG
jgi:hypothetical protein